MSSQFSNLASMDELATGFPASTEAFLQASLDLNQHLLRHPAATFYMRVASHQPVIGLLRGDLLMVDRAESAENGSTVIAIMNGEFIVTKIKRQSGMLSILSERNSSYWSTVQEGVNFEVWGVVLYVIREL